MDNIDCFGLGHKICARTQPCSVLPWNNKEIMKLKCCVVPPLGMMKTLYLLLLSLLCYTLLPLMTTGNCLSYLHLVKLLTYEICCNILGALCPTERYLSADIALFVQHFSWDRNCHENYMTALTLTSLNVSFGLNLSIRVWLSFRERVWGGRATKIRSHIYLFSLWSVLNSLHCCLLRAPWMLKSA